jgi:hypothetical protein
MKSEKNILGYWEFTRHRLSGTIDCERYVNMGLYMPIVRFCCRILSNFDKSSEIRILVSELIKDGYKFGIAHEDSRYVWLSQSMVAFVRTAPAYSDEVFYSEEIPVDPGKAGYENEFLIDYNGGYLLTANPSYTYNDTEPTGNMMCSILSSPSPVCKYVVVAYAEFARTAVCEIGRTVTGRPLLDPYNTFGLNPDMTGASELTRERVRTLENIIQSFVICPLWGSAQTQITALGCKSPELISYKPLADFQKDNISFNELFIELVMDGFFPVEVSGRHLMYDDFYMDAETSGTSCISNAFGNWPSIPGVSVEYASIIRRMREALIF